MLGTVFHKGRASFSGRIPHLLLGLCAGVAVWFLGADGWRALGGQSSDAARAVLMIVVLCGFGAAGILLAKLGLARALGAGALIAALTGSLAWVSMRGFEDASAYFVTGHVLVALFVLAALPVPFLQGFLQDGQGLSYRHLFVNSWDIVVRYGAAWAFAGLALAVAFACGALLEIVGLRVLSDLLREDLVVAALLGGLVGLGLAVVDELDDMISPDLALRLVRLLAPFVLVVLVVFLAMVPVRGLTALFGALSTGGSLMTAGFGAVVLVSIIVDKSDLDGPSRGILYLSARILAGLVILLAGLAIAAVWMRVEQYGWTPERVSAAVVSDVLLGYGVVYALALLRGARWRAGVRSGNLGLALVMIALAALWLNPWVTPESISMRSQIARLDPEADAERFPLWEMAHDWGHAGKTGIAALEAVAGPRMTARLALLERSTSRYAFTRGVADPDAERARIAALLPVLPEGRSLDAAFFEAVEGRSGVTDTLETECALTTPEGHRGCLVVYADVIADWDGEEILVLREDRAPVLFASETRDRQNYLGSGVWDLPDGMTVAQAIDLFWRDGIRLVPSRDQEFSLGGQRMAPRAD